MEHPRERLRRWIEEVHGGSKAEAARQIGCDPSYLVHLLRDPKRSVGLDFAVAVAKATVAWPDGQIREADWVDAKTDEAVA